MSAQRNLLLVSYGILLGLNFAFRTAFHFRLPDWGQLGGFAPLLVVAAKLLYAASVYRLSRFLDQPIPVTLLYTVLAVVGGFDAVPLVALLVAVRIRRGMIEAG